MEKIIKETTRLLLKGTIPKDIADKILLDLFSVVGQREKCFCEKELGTTKDGKCLNGCYHNEK